MGSPGDNDNKPLPYGQDAHLVALSPADQVSLWGVLVWTASHGLLGPQWSILAWLLQTHPLIILQSYSFLSTVCPHQSCSQKAQDCHHGEDM